MPSRSLEDRISKIEHRISYVLGGIAVLTALGIGLSYFTNKISENIPSEAKVATIKSEITTHAKNEIDKLYAAKGYSKTSVLAQVQAQAACVAITAPHTTVYAVYRGETSKSNGRYYSDKCSQVCPRLVPKAEGTGKVGKYVGSVHIYDKNPPFTKIGNSFLVGMATHKYPASSDADTFGPNYCCCSG